MIAHRGASARWPENTVAAFAGAAQLGADWVELDVRPAADGTLVVSHDPVLPDGRPLAATAPADLPSHVPSLAEALAACGSLGVNVEIKNDPGEPGFDGGGTLVAAVVEVVDRLLPSERSLISCFHLPTLDRVRITAPHLPTGFLFYLPIDDAQVAAVAAAGHRALNPHHLLVDAAFVARAEAHGLAVHPWTVDDPERIAELARLGVDSVITNVPDVARQVLDQR